jgi:hypothetical protein
MCKLLLFVLCTPNWSDTKNILSCGTVQSGRYALTFQSICRLHHQDDGGGRFLSDVTYLPADSGWTKVMSNIIITTLRTSHLNLCDTQQVLDISAKIWLVWDCKFRYLIVVCVWVVCQGGVCEQFRRGRCLLVVEIWAADCSDLFALLGCGTVQFDRHVSGLYLGTRKPNIILNSLWLNLALLHEIATPFRVHLHPSLLTFYTVKL